MFGMTDLRNEIKTIEEQFKDIEITQQDLKNEIAKIDARMTALDSRKSISEDLGGRVAELELKMHKLWSLLLETSPATGREKLSKFGRKFGGRSKGLI